MRPAQKVVPSTGRQSRKTRSTTRLSLLNDGPSVWLVDTGFDVLPVASRRFADSTSVTWAAKPKRARMRSWRRSSDVLRNGSDSWPAAGLMFAGAPALSVLKFRNGTLLLSSYE